MADITSTTSAPNAGLSFLGQYSGITTDVVDQLIEAESGGKVLLQNKVKTYTNEKAAWSEISSSLSNFQTKLKSLQSDDSYYSKIATSSNDDLATISGNSQTKNGGSFELTVSQLAVATKLTGKQVTGIDSNSDKLSLTGKLTFAYQGPKTDDSPETVDIEIQDKDSLLDVADHINRESKQTGVAANVIDKRLVLTNLKSGAKETTLDQSKNGATLQALGLDTTAKMGQPAQFSLDGIALESDSNVVSDAISGATLTLKKVIPADEAVTLSLKNDDSKTLAVANDFVKQYNNLMDLLKADLDVGDPSATGTDGTSNLTGKLVGDSTVQRLQSSLRNMISQSDKEHGATLSPFDLGFSVDKEGTLSLDESKFKDQLADSPQKVHDFFYVADEQEGFDETKATGYTAKLNGLVNEFISDTASKTGIIKNKTDSIDKMVKNLNSQIDDFTQRLADKRDQYITQFTNLDTIMMNAESQLQYLQSQMNPNQGQS